MTRCAAVLLLAACADGSPAPCVELASNQLTRSFALSAIEVSLESVEPSRLLPGTHITLEGQGLTGEPGTIPEVLLLGRMSGPRGDATVDFRTNARVEGEKIIIPVDRDFYNGVGGEEGSFSGSISVQTYVGVGRQPVTVSQPWFFDLFRSIEPLFIDINLGSHELYPGDAIVVDGDGFLRPEEGLSQLQIRGQFVPENGAAEYSVDASIAITPSTDRRTGRALFTPDAFGPEPGVLREGTIELLHAPKGVAQQIVGPAIHRDLAVRTPFISEWTADAPSRGQRLRIRGRGFLPDARTLLRLDGSFYPDGSSTSSVLENEILAPDRWLDGETIEMTLWTQTSPEGKLTGLSAQPGQFVGTVTPVLVADGREVEGIPWNGGFEIGTSRQAVWLKFLPTFADTLEGLFGLRAVEHRIRARVFEVIRRDYADFAVDFSEARPEDMAEFSILEVGGPDANNLGLFGLDNTEGKDTGNLRLNDIIGGANAASGEQGYPTFGGVFIESFVGFSPQAKEPLPIASAAFDMTLAPFAPFLCGRPVSAEEVHGGSRGADIEEAIRVFGNVVGSTVVHEIGHSLGLTQSVAGETAFHNLGDGDYIMDAGTNRSFAERAEIGTSEPPKWHPANWEYMREILPPRDQP